MSLRDAPVGVSFVVMRGARDSNRVVACPRLPLAGSRPGPHGSASSAPARSSPAISRRRRRAGAPPPAHTSIVVLPPVRPSSPGAASGVIGPRSAGSAPSAASPSAAEGPLSPPATGVVPAPATLVPAKLLAKLETGGCGLVSLDDSTLYARAPSCREVLRIDRRSGALSTAKLPSAMLVQTVAAGVAVGCPLGGSACKLTSAPLDGSAARQLAVLPGFLDGPGESRGARVAALFAPVDAAGKLDLAAQQFSVETVDLGSGARSVVFGPVGIGRAVISAKGVLFAGALIPKENVRSPSWGLWSIEAGAPPRRLPTSQEVASFSSDERDVYYVDDERNVWRVGLDGKREEKLAGPLESPPDEPGRLRVTPHLTAGPDAVYVSTTSTTACWIWQIAKP